MKFCVLKGSQSSSSVPVAAVRGEIDGPFLIHNELLSVSTFDLELPIYFTYGVSKKSSLAEGNFGIRFDNAVQEFVATDHPQTVIVHSYFRASEMTVFTLFTIVDDRIMKNIKCA